MSGQIINFGKYKGKNIKYIFIKDYVWLYREMRKPKFSWIKTYIEQLPCIYPKKIKVHCGENHHAGCKTRKATRVSFYSHKGRVIIQPNSGNFWCNECDIYSGGAPLGTYKLDEYLLKFETVKDLDKDNTKNFIEILKEAYGIKELTNESAYDLFWK